MRLLLILFLLLAGSFAQAGLFENKPNPVLGAPLNNSADFLPVRQAFQLSVGELQPEGLVVRFVIAEGYYLYRHRLQFSSTDPSVQVRVVDLPAGEPKVDEYFGSVEVFRQILEVQLQVDNPEQRPFSLKVDYQGCADKGLCYPPEQEVFPLLQKAPPSASKPDVLAPKVQSLSLTGLLLFYLAGLGLAFTPCVLPMLPILSGVLLQGQPSKKQSLGLALAYVLSMSLCFAALGVLMGLFGAELNLQARLQSPWLLVPFAGFFVLLALSLFGLFELQWPQWIRGPIDQLAGRIQGGSWLGSAALGVLSSLLLSPCVSAPLAGALLYISHSGDAWGGGLQLWLLGLGMGTPLILLAVGGSTLLPRSGPWMLGVRHLFGVLLLAVALWMLERILPGSLSLWLWGSLAVGSALYLGILDFAPKTPKLLLRQLIGLSLLVYGLSCWVGALQGQSDPLRPLAQATYERTSDGAVLSQNWIHLDTPEALTQELNAARSRKQPVVLDWYADWCISCKVIERQVLQHEAVVPRLAAYRLLRLDITRNTPEQRALLSQFKIFGPPAILFFNQQGEEVVDARVLGEVDRAAFLSILERFEQQISPANERGSTAITL